MLISKNKTDNSVKSITSKENISLSKPERLYLLTRDDTIFDIAKKHTSAYRQIEEMKDLYEFICVLFAKILPDEEAEYNFMMFELFPEGALDNTQLKFLNNYSAIEKCLLKISNIFYEYFNKYPDIYEEQMLDEYSFDIIDIVETSRQMLQDNPEWAEEVFKRWGLLE